MAGQRENWQTRRLTSRGIKVAPEQGILGKNYPGKQTGNPYGPPGSAYLKKNSDIMNAIERAWNILFRGAPLGYDESTWKPK